MMTELLADHMAVLQGSAASLHEMSAIPQLCKRYEDCKRVQGGNSHAALYCLRALAHEHCMAGSEADLKEAVKHLNNGLHVCARQSNGLGLTQELAMRAGIMFELADVQIRLNRYHMFQ